MARKPVCYGYGRVSTEGQVDSGLSLTHQEVETRRYYEYRLVKSHRWGGFLADQAVSGSKKFRERPIGGQLDKKLQAGDVVVVAKMDRAFRSVLDMIATLDMWREREIRVAFLDLNVDTTTPTGVLMLQILAAFAEWERARIKERTAEAKKVARKRAGTNPKRMAVYSGPAWWGFKWMKDSTGAKCMVPDDEARYVGRTIVAWRKAGLTPEEIRVGLIDQGIHIPGKPGKFYTAGSIAKVYTKHVAMLRWEQQYGKKTVIYPRDTLTMPLLRRGSLRKRIRRGAKYAQKARTKWGEGSTQHEGVDLPPTADDGGGG